MVTWLIPVERGKESNYLVTMQTYPAEAILAALWWLGGMIKDYFHQMEC